MRLFRTLSFAFVIILTLLISHNFANAQEGYIGDDEIIINGETYKRTETEFSKIEPTDGGVYNYDSDFPYIYDEGEYPTEDSFPNLDGQTITPTVVCDNPSGTNCYSMGIPGTAIGEHVYGEYFGESDLWQKIDVNGEIYYVPMNKVSGVVDKAVGKNTVNHVSARDIKKDAFNLKTEWNKLNEIDAKMKQQTYDYIVERQPKSKKFIDAYIKANSYVNESVAQIIKGNYTDKVTLLGTTGQVVAGFFGVDAPLDVRDLVYDFTHWEWSWGHTGHTVLDGIGLVPVIGLVKNVDEVATLVKSIKVNAVADAGKKAARFIGDTAKKSYNAAASAARKTVDAIGSSATKAKNAISRSADSTKRTIKSGLDKIAFWKKSPSVKIGSGEEMTTFTHMTSVDNARSIEKDGFIFNNAETGFFGKLFDGSDPKIWGSEGGMSWIKRQATGLPLQNPAKTEAVFEIKVPQSIIEQPGGFKNIFGEAQKVIKGTDVNSQGIPGLDLSKYEYNVKYKGEVPKKAYDTYDSVVNNNFVPPASYKGNRVFKNYDEKLPIGGKYAEYDVDPKIKGVERNSERIIIEKESKDAWYTGDHYDSFVKIGTSKPVEKAKAWYEFWK